MTFYQNTPDTSYEKLQLVEGVLGPFAHCGITHDRLNDERASAEALGRVSTATKAQAFLDCGIICLLQGETQVAFKHLKDAAAISFDKPRIYLQALSYGLQCLYMGYRWTLDGRSVPMDEMDPLYNLEEALPYWLNKINEVKRHVGSAAMQQLPYLLEQQRSIVSKRGIIDHRPLPSSQQLQSVQLLEQNIRLHCSGVVPFQKTATLLLEISGLYYQVHHVQHATSIVTDLLRQHSEINDIAGMAHCEMKLGDFKSTSIALPESWGIVLRQGIDSNVSNLHDQFPESSLTPAKIDESLVHYDMAYSLFEQARYRRGMASVNLRYGYIKILRAKDGNAVDHYRDALQFVTAAQETYSGTGDIIASQTARAHSILCRVGIGQLPEDRISAKEIGTWGRTKGSISYVFGLGIFFAAHAQRWVTEGGDYERGLAAFRLSEALFDGLGLPRAYTASIVDQLSVHEMLGEHDRFIIAAEHVLRAYQLLYVQAASPLASWARSRAAHILQRMLNRAIARENPDEIERAVTRIRSIYPQRRQEDILNDLVALYDNMILSGTSSELNLESVGEIGSDTTTQTSVSTAEFLEHIFRAKHAAQRGDMHVAEANWDLAELRARESGDSHAKELLLARVSTARRRYDEAAAHLNSYLDLRLTATASMRRHGASLNFAEDQMGLIDKQRRNVYTTLLQGFAAIGQFDQAGEILDILVGQYGEEWWRMDDDVSNLTAAAEVKEGLGQFPSAWEFYGKATQISEDRRSRLSLDEYKLAIASSSLSQGLYFKAARTAVKWHESLAWSVPLSRFSNHLQEAFRSLERGKTRSLLDLMAAGTLMYGQIEPSDLREWDEYRKTSAHLATKRGMLSQQYSSKSPKKNRIDDLEKDISKAEVKLNQLEEGLFAEKSPAARHFVTTTDVTDIGSLRSQVDEDTVVLQYSYRGDDLLAWAITSDGIAEVHRLSVSDVELELRVSRYREKCESSAQDLEGDGDWLAGQLFPFNETLEKFHLIIIAYRALHTLPFHALPWRGGPLLATHSVSYLPSASSISYLQPHRTVDVGLRVLSVGNPSDMKHEDAVSGATQDLKELWYAEAEARYIASINAGSRSLIGREATKQAVTENIEQYDVMHFATHGSLCAEVPMMSSVALADGQELTVSELMGRRLKTSLVVLSACDTGAGHLTNGDDIVGFARALLAAGVRSIVVSLWPVDDLATSLLMRTFYEHLQDGQTGAAALREAQMALRNSKREDMELHAVEIRRTCGDRVYERSVAPEINQGSAKNYDHPKFWAPFIFIGIR